VKNNAKRGLTAFGALALLGSVAVGVYYFLFVRSRKPQVELYFDDGSMLALPGDAAEAESFMTVASEVLRTNPIAG
jgi:hypothetical protein